VFVASTDWRCTTKPGKVYLILFKWPNGSFELSNLHKKVKKAYLLGGAGRQTLKVRQQVDRVNITLPPKAPGPMASVVVVETAGN